MTDRVVVVRPQPERVVVRGGLPGPKGEPGTSVIADGSITIPKLAFDPATQAELDAHTHPIGRTTVTTAAYTAVLGDANKVVRMTFVGPSTLTIPANATAAFPLDTIINPYAAGGALTIAAAAGVTIDNNTSGVAQGVEVSLRQDAINKWVRVG